LSFKALYGDETQLNNRPATWLQENLPLSLETLGVMHVVHSAPQVLDEQLRGLMNDMRFSALNTIQVLGEEDGGDSPEEDDEEFSEDEEEDVREDEVVPDDVALENFQRMMADYQRILDSRT